MATYHVQTNPKSNIIYAGTINKKGDKWLTQTDVTNECLEAVRDHFLWVARKEETNEIGYHWEYSNGSSIFLKIVIEEKPETKIEEKE